MTPEKRKSMTSHHTAKDFKAGDTVHVISMDTTGTVTAPADSKGNIKVQMGILSSLLPASDLVIIETPKQNNAQVSINNKRGMGKALNIQPEINVLGMTVAEATSLVDRYLDDAMMAHLHSILPVRDNPSRNEVDIVSTSNCKCICSCTIAVLTL